MSLDGVGLLEPLWSAAGTALGARYVRGSISISVGGEVREIGSRASTIRAWDGAEVIVPNGRLTSENVTNWTLSDRLYRLEVRVPVTYASDPRGRPSRSARPPGRAPAIRCGTCARPRSW